MNQLINEAKNQGREDVRFYAFDFSQQSVDEAKKLSPDANLYCDDILTPSNPITKNQKFDYVFSKDVIFFFTEGEKKTVFNNLKSLTKLGGKLHILAREERFDRESHPNFHDLPISGYRELFEEAGFKIDESKISKKIPYGAPVRGNLDRFYPVIEIIGENMGDVKQIPNPTTEAYEYASAKRKENAQKAMGSSQMKGCLGR